MIIAEYYEKICHHELQSARAEEERRILKEELWRQQKDFREVHQQSFIDYWYGKIPEFYFRYARKTEAHITCLPLRKVKNQNKTNIWDANLDRNPKIHSSSVEKTVQRIMGQTNKYFRLRIFTLTSSSHKRR